MPQPKEKLHPVLQLHGGGTLVLSQVIKCAIIEGVTGKRIPDLFPSIIADSGGAIIALGLHFKSAEDLLHLFMKKLPDVLPNRSFFFSQALARKKFHFDPSGLEEALRDVFAHKTLGDITGNVFIRTHSIDGHALRISKISGHRGAEYTHANQHTRLVDILLKATAIPGILPEPEGKYIDTLTDQNPLAVIIKLKNKFPNDQFEYVIAGNIHHDHLPESFRKKSFIGNYLRGSYQNYAALHRQSAHLEDLAELINADHITSLTTFSSQQFSSIDNSPQQRENVIIATLKDIEERANEYTQLAQKLLGKNKNLAMSVEEARTHILQGLDCYMPQAKAPSADSPYDAPDQLSKPDIVAVSDRTPYKIGYMTGYFLTKAYPQLARIIISNDFNWESIRADMRGKVSYNLLPSRRVVKSAAEPSATPEL